MCEYDHYVCNYRGCRKVLPFPYPICVVQCEENIAAVRANNMQPVKCGRKRDHGTKKAKGPPPVYCEEHRRKLEIKKGKEDRHRRISKMKADNALRALDRHNAAQDRASGRQVGA
jgi:hypothetical protein